MHTSPRYERAPRTTRPATRRGSRRLAAELLRAASSLLDRYAAALAAAEVRAAEREARAVREGRLALHGAWYSIFDATLWLRDPVTGDDVVRIVVRRRTAVEDRIPSARAARSRTSTFAAL